MIVYLLEGIWSLLKFIIYFFFFFRFFQLISTSLKA